MLKLYYCSRLKSLLEQILFGQPVAALVYIGENFTESSVKPIYTLMEFDVKYLNHLLKLSTGRNIWSGKKNNLGRKNTTVRENKLGHPSTHANYNSVSHISIVFKITAKFITNNSLAITLH